VEVKRLKLEGLRVISPKVFRDERGFFLEPYNKAKYQAAGINEEFVQDNHSRSVARTLRGLHYQGKPGQAKLVRVAVGSIVDVAVDIRPDSPTFGQWEAVELTAERHEQIYVPVGFAHGFCVTSETAEVLYKVSSPYDAKEEFTISWNDPELAVAWPVKDPILSARDKAGESFADFKRRNAL
jgi:dTDP-4-dehydrorhamnose 3,5-epimerase